MNYYFTTLLRTEISQKIYTLYAESDYTQPLLLRIYTKLTILKSIVNNLLTRFQESK